MLVIDVSKQLIESFGTYSTSIVKSLVKNLQHQHSKVRKMTLDVHNPLVRSASRIILGFV
jgi:hypothetical protein